MRKLKLHEIVLFAASVFFSADRLAISNLQQIQQPFVAYVPLDKEQESLRVWPVEGNITSDYGFRIHNKREDWHDGIDIKAKKGTRVLSVSGGIVKYVCNSRYNKCNDHGSNIYIKHDDGTYTRYAHLSKIFITEGIKVRIGQTIGLSGNTGKVRGQSGGYHLHFEAYNSDRAIINPSAYLPKKRFK